MGEVYHDDAWHFECRLPFLDIIQLHFPVLICYLEFFGEVSCATDLVDSSGSLYYFFGGYHTHGIWNKGVFVWLER